MDKYLVFALEKWGKVEVVAQPSIEIASYTPPKYEDRKVPCFELIKEFERAEGWPSLKYRADNWAEAYSKENKVRTLVIRGDIFE